MIKYILLFISLVSIPYDSYSCEPVKRIIGNEKFKIYLVEYSAKKSKKLVLIIPPTGGINFIDKSYAKSLCEANISAVIIRNWTGDDEYSLELEIHTRFYNRAQKAIESTLNVYKSFQLGVLGTSVGGLHGSIALARFSQLKTGLFIVSGGGIASLIANTTQQVLVDAKEKRFKKFNFKNNQEYISALKKILPFEPLELKFDPTKKKIGMIISSNDDVVPTINQKELQKKWNSTILLTSWFGHTTTVVKTWLFNSSEVIDFFR